MAIFCNKMQTHSEYAYYYDFLRRWKNFDSCIDCFFYPFALIFGTVSNLLLLIKCVTFKTTLDKANDMIDFGVLSLVDMLNVVVLALPHAANCLKVNFF